RTLFGTTVRAELFNFFFGGGFGNSKSIAEYTQLSQSTVHTILNELVTIGLIDKRGRSRSTSYEIVKGDFTLEGLRPEVYFDWANYIKSIIKAWKRLESLSKPDSEYKTRSALRQFAFSFRDNLSDWNAKFVDNSVLKKIQAKDLMEKEEPAEDVLAFIKQLPKQAGRIGSRGS
ncbi:MAG: winged helix-turn-helix domain-containing protein, partial [Candidatus Bipolaricaulota bacterium]